MEGIPKREPLTTEPDGTVDADEVLAFIDELDPTGTNPRAQAFKKVVENLKAQAIANSGNIVRPEAPKIKLRENITIAKFDVPEGQEFPAIGQKPVEVHYSGDDFKDDEGNPITVIKKGEEIDESESFNGR